MLNYYACISISHIKIAEIFKGCGNLSPSQVIGKNISVDVIFEADVIAYRAVDASRASFFEEITKQYDLDQKYGDSYTPSAIMDIKPYICFKFQIPQTEFSYTIEKGSTIQCFVTDISPYFKRMTLQETLYLIKASDYLQSNDFSKLLRSVDEGVMMVHGLYGTAITLGNRKVTLTNGYRSIVIKTNIDANMYEMLYLLWNDFITSHVGGTYTEKVMRLNNVDNGAYIMLQGCAIEDLMSNQNFVRGLLKS